MMLRRQSSRRRLRWITPVITVFVVAGVVLLSAAVLHQNTYATLITGNPGTGGGGGGAGAPNTGSARNHTKGYGWAVFSAAVGSPAPMAMKSGTWAAVTQQCRNANISQVAAFIIMTDNTANPTHGWVYTYTNEPQGPTTYGNYLGGNGGMWISNDTAYSQYIQDGGNGGAWGSSVGWYCYGQANWSVSGSTSISETSAKVGDTVTWTHTLTTTQGTAPTIYSNIAYNSTPGNYSSSPAATDGANVSGTGTIRRTSKTQKITAAEGGQTFCQWIQWDPQNSAGDRNGRSGEKCVTVPYSYTLNPTVSLTPSSGSLDPGSSVTVNPKITNNGPTRSENTINYKVVSFTVPAGSSPAVTANKYGTTTFAASTYGSGAKTIATGTKGPISYPTGTTGTIAGLPQLIPEDALAGQHVCYGIAIQPATSNATNHGKWLYGPSVCILVGKHPLVDVEGGDLRATGTGAVSVGASTMYDGNQNRVYGSWVEYGLLAAGDIQGMTSGGYDAYSGNKTGVVAAATASPNTTCEFDRLTLANSKCGSGVLGNYADADDLQPISTVSAAFKSATGLPSSSFSVSSLASGAVYAGTGGGTYTITGGTVKAGQWDVINYPNANVEITNDVQYTTDTLSSVSQIPQLVIIAKNIYIDPQVTNVDSWLYASNAIFTCAVNGAGTVTTNTNLITTGTTGNGCGNPLTVHGPVSTPLLYMWRSPEGGQGAPGETFDLRADSYLWAYNQAQSSNGISTLTTSEKPPRF